MEEPIPATCLNDFIFCPASIYFHRFFDSFSTYSFQSTDQINGTAVHTTVDDGIYSTRKDIITGLDGYSEEYNLICKIDTYYSKTGTLIEKKKRIKTIYDGYVFQIYAQYFCLKEMGYDVKKLQLYSNDDNKKYNIPLPEDDIEMFSKFKNTIASIMSFELEKFSQSNIEKCRHCIYEPACDRTLIREGGIGND